MPTATLEAPATEGRLKEWDERHQEFETWARTVRDPAPYFSEGKRIIQVGSCKMEYEISHLPDGRWAGRYAFWASGYSGSWNFTSIIS